MTKHHSPVTLATVAESSICATLQYYMRPDRSPDDCSTLCTAARLDFGGAPVGGALTVQATDETLASSCPVNCGREAELLHDWACELTNLLVGALKQALRSYGVMLALKTPGNVCASTPQRRSGEKKNLVVKHGGFVVIVSFDGDAPIPLTEDPNDPSEVGSGGVVFF